MVLNVCADSMGSHDEEELIKMESWADMSLHIDDTANPSGGNPPEPGPASFFVFEEPEEDVQPDEAAPKVEPEVKPEVFFADPTPIATDKMPKEIAEAVNDVKEYVLPNDLYENPLDFVADDTIADEFGALEIIPEVVVGEVDEKLLGDNTVIEDPETVYVIDDDDSLQQVLQELHQPTFQPFQCDLCEYETVNGWNMYVHVNEAHRGNVPEGMCVLCGKSFASKSAKERHIQQVHCNEKPLTTKIEIPDPVSCDSCGVTHYSEADRLRHLQEAHPNDESNQCHVCDKVLSSRSNWHRHLKDMHGIAEDKAPATDTLSQECHICRKKFRYQANLRKHLRNEHEEEEQPQMVEPAKDHHCQICNKSFAYQANYEKHMNSHEEPEDVIVNDESEEQEIFTCEFCDMQFSFAGNHLKHLKSIHGFGRDDTSEEEEAMCDFCSKTFASKSNRERHIRTVHQKAYRESLKGANEDLICNICKRVFVNTVNRDRHVSTVHFPTKDPLSNSPLKLADLDKKIGKDEEGKFQCEECGKAFWSRNNVKRHLREVHAGMGRVHRPSGSDDSLKENHESLVPSTLIKSPLKAANGNPLVLQNVSENIQRPRYVPRILLRDEKLIEDPGVFKEGMMIRTSSKGTPAKRSNSTTPSKRSITPSKNSSTSCRQSITPSKRQKTSPRSEGSIRKADPSPNVKSRNVSKADSTVKSYSLYESASENADKTTDVDQGKQCELCRKSFGSRTNRNRHIVEVHKIAKGSPKFKRLTTPKGKGVTPAKVKKSFNAPTEVPVIDELSCGLCDKSFSSKTNRNRHVVEVHGFDRESKMFKKVTTPKKSPPAPTKPRKISDFFRPADSNKTTPSHSPAKKSKADFTCDYCRTHKGIDYGSKAKLKAHIEEEHPLACDFCDTRFKNMKGLRAHTGLYHEGGGEIPTESITDGFRGFAKPKREIAFRDSMKDFRKSLEEYDFVW